MGASCRRGFPEAAVRAGAAAGEIMLRLGVDEDSAGGRAVYGERFGR